MQLLFYFTIFAFLVSCSSTKSLRDTHFNGNKSKRSSINSDKSEKKASFNSVVIKPNNFIQEWIGVPYKWGGMSKSGVDCSGFVYRYYQNVYQLTINRTTNKQFNQGVFVKKTMLKSGDLVFFKGTTGRAGISHVGVYLNDMKFVHASTSKGVTISSLDEPYFIKHYAGAKRIIN